MLRNVNHLLGCRIVAGDGDIGHVDDVFFDSGSWHVRYIVVDTGKWLTGRRVLVSPAGVSRLEWEEQRLFVNMTREQVRNSPDVDTHQPISRRKELEYNMYFGWPNYWMGGAIPPAPAIQFDRPPARPVLEEDPEDVHLRSMNEVIGYYIEASDGDIGHVEDFVIDDQDWRVRYLIIDTKNWWQGKKVLVSTEWIERVSWEDSKVVVGLSKDSIRNSPEFNPALPVDRGYEEELHAHYDRPRYWR